MDLSPEENEISVPYYDVIIVGGSVAGCATALSVLNSQPEVSILVLDDCDPSAFKIGESLPAVAKQVLAGLCPPILERVSEDNLGEHGVFIKCTGNASCWDSPSLEETRAITSPFGMGWHLDRAKFDQILRESMMDVSRNRISLVKSSFEDVSLAEVDDRWLVLTSSRLEDSGMIYGSRWLIDASGRKAVVSRKLGAKTIKEDSLLAFYAVFVRPSITDDGDHRTLIEACESGWWYSSPLPGNRRVVAYHTDDTDPTVDDARQPDGFMNFLHYSTIHISRLISESEYDIDVQSKTRYPVCTTASSTRTTPLSGIVASSGARWCAVGDAAMAFDPLSSQGMITALQVGAALGNIVARDMVTKSEDDILAAVPKLYSQVWSKYTQEKRYIYSRGRFEGDFWKSRR
ncbi:FAD/NAD(P)-binding domain-containing protein [Imleria badia]|nr:FAD/NAD(P)-binding domain-containing protein [Imleria badia]